ncbi:unnamed protein product [Heterosigma akashiwo]
MGGFMKTAGFRNRLMNDPSFLTKCAMEIGIGGVCQLAAEVKERGDKLLQQLDFVVADVLTCVIANFMAVWLAAPTLAALAPPPAAAGNAVKRFFDSCPGNAFQKVTPGRAPFTVAQRCGTLVGAFPQLFLVGFAASVAGFGFTLGLSKLREKLNPASAEEEPLGGPAKEVQVLKPALVIGAYLGVSTNVRYQLVAGLLEERLLGALFANQQFLNTAGSFIFRTGNTFVGSSQMVMTLKWTGLAGDEEN